MVGKSVLKSSMVLYKVVPPYGAAGVCLVFVRQEQGGDAAVVLRDDPELLALHVILRQDSSAVIDGPVVGSLVFLVQVSPVSGHVHEDVGHHAIQPDGLNDARRGNEVTQSEPWRKRSVRNVAHVGDRGGVWCVFHGCVCLVVLLDKLTAVGAPSDAHAVGFRCVLLPAASVGDAPQAFGKCHGRVCLVVCLVVCLGVLLYGFLVVPLAVIIFSALQAAVPKSQRVFVLLPREPPCVLVPGSACGLRFQSAVSRYVGSGRSLSVVGHGFTRSGF